jgi:uncharacterized protein YjiS (DUF1127 family)
MYRYNPSASTIEIRRRPANRFLGALRVVFDFAGAWRDRRRQRLALGRLDDRLLRDIGMSAADVEHEITKPFWR